MLFASFIFLMIKWMNDADDDDDDDIADMAIDTSVCSSVLQKAHDK